MTVPATDYAIPVDPDGTRPSRSGVSDLALRIGQTRPVTIEENIVQLHHAKRDLDDSLLEGTDTAHTLTADELIGLLRNR